MILAIIALAIAITGVYLANQYYKKKNQAPPIQSISDNVQEMMSKYKPEQEVKQDVVEEDDIVELPLKKKKKYYHHKKI